MPSLQPGSLPAPSTARLRAQIANAHVPTCYGYGQSSSSQNTLGSNFTLETPFTGARLILMNYSTTALTLAGLCAAVSASAADYTTPVLAGGAAAPWAAVTSGGAVPTVPAGTQARPAIALTDLIPIESVSRTDGGTGYLLYTRASGKSGGPTIFNVRGALSADTAFDSNTPGRPLMDYYIAGSDYASSNQAGLTLANASLNFPGFVVGGVIFYAEGRCVTVVGCGDSLTQGFQAGAGYSGFARIAAASMSNTVSGVSYVDAGYTGQTTAQIVARATDLITAGVPMSVITLPIDSPNDYQASPAIPRVQQEANMLALVDLALSKNIAVVLLTSIPFMLNGVDVQGAQRVISSTKLRTYLQRGVMLLDAQTIICGYTPTASQLAITPATLLGGDSQHLNAAGQGLLAARLQQLIGGQVTP